MVCDLAVCMKTVVVHLSTKTRFKTDQDQTGQKHTVHFVCFVML